MANEEKVYSFEENFETGITSALSIILSAQKLFFGDQDIHKTPRVETTFTYGGVDQTDKGFTPNGSLYLRKHSGTIDVIIHGKTKAIVNDLCGKIRNAFSWNLPRIVQPALPYYQIQSIFEQSSSRSSSTSEEDFEVQTTLTFEVSFQIPAVVFTEELVYNGQNLTYNGLILNFGNA